MGSVAEFEQFAAGVAGLAVALEEEPDDRRADTAADQQQGGEDQQDDDDRDGARHAGQVSRGRRVSPGRGCPA